jgi:hypothetical protein
MKDKTVGYLALGLWMLVVLLMYINIWIETPGTNSWGYTNDIFPHDKVWMTIGATGLFAVILSVWAIIIAEPTDEEA